MDASWFDGLARRFARRRLSRRAALAAGGTGAVGLTALAFSATTHHAVTAQDATPAATEGSDVRNSFLATYRTMTQEFARRAAKAGLKVQEDMKMVTGWYEEVFVSHVGVASSERFDNGRPLSILSISTPADLSLQGEAEAAIPPGTYVLKSYIQEGWTEGYVDVTDESGTSVARLAINNNGGGGCGGLSHTCEDVTDPSMTYDKCVVCIDWNCGSQCHQSCITIPFCDSVTGSLDDIVG